MKKITAIIIAIALILSSAELSSKTLHFTLSTLHCYSLRPMATKYIKIGEGSCRVVYQTDSKVIKILKTYKQVRRSKFLFMLPMKLCMLKYTMADYNKYEYNSYRNIISKSVPERYSNSFVKIYGVIKSKKGNILVAELIKDADGKTSKSLAEYGPVYDDEFWERLNKLEKLFRDDGIYLLGIDAENIHVKRLKNGELIPVFVDYKKLARRFYPRWLFSTKAKLEQKTTEGFKRIREGYNVASKTQGMLLEKAITAFAECA
ncbi:MAG: YrbL family protein [Candidatus Omnitrophota bacterium]